MARRATLRASDADREIVAERLRHAASEGRLRTEELEHRLEAAFSARTYGELDALVADLPELAPSGRRGRAVGRPDWMPPALVPLAVVIAAPVVMAVAAAALLTVASLLAAWSVWLAVGWCVFGHARRRVYGVHGRRQYADHHGPTLHAIRRVARETGRVAREQRAFWA